MYIYIYYPKAVVSLVRIEKTINWSDRETAVQSSMYNYIYAKKEYIKLMLEKKKERVHFFVLFS